MDPSLGCTSTLPSPSPIELAAHSGSQYQDPADRAREKLLAISEADASCDLRDIAKSVVGEKGVEKEVQSPALSPETAKEDADEDEEYRNKLISISYDEAPLAIENISQPDGVHVTSPPAADGHCQPPA